MFNEIYLESMSDYSVTEKLSIEENMKSSQIRGSLNRLYQKNNPVFKG